jgi:hypothetical protein
MAWERTATNCSTQRSLLSGPEILRNVELMKIPYRLTSSAALGALALSIAESFVPRAPRAAGFELCGLIDDQWETMPKLVALVCLGAYVVFTVQGLRNRSGPRWLAIAGVPALVLALVEQSERVRSGCYTKAGLVWFLILLSAAMIMFLHHAVQPRIPGRVKDKVTGP